MMVGPLKNLIDIFSQYNQRNETEVGVNFYSDNPSVTGEAIFKKITEEICIEILPETF